MNSNSIFKPDVESFANPFFFFANNPDQQILYVSPSVKEILGYSPADIVGRKYTDFLDAGNSHNQDVDEMHQKRYQGDHHHFSLRVVSDAEGSDRVLKVQTCGKTDENGQVVASHGIAEDVTKDYMKKNLAGKRLKQLLAIEAKLSEREKTVLKYVIKGTPNKSIARQLSITERAIEMIRARLVKKTGVESTAQLVSQATELNTLRTLISDTTPFFDLESDTTPTPTAGLAAE
ncbi:LuxR C-terminal-related transcriptional regulator [bacterium]|nr:LuxR C-terminal-related transcriptional regulator [bacterium]